MSSRVSTFAPVPVVLAAVLAAIFISSRGRFRSQPAMQPIPVGRGKARPVAKYRVPAQFFTVTMNSSSSSTSDRIRRLVHEALGMRAPQPAEFGKAARIGPLRRLRSAILLLALLVALGVATASTIGIIVFLAGFLLEQAIK